jgi:hypothetical protein
VRAGRFNRNDWGLGRYVDTKSCFCGKIREPSSTEALRHEALFRRAFFISPCLRVSVSAHSLLLERGTLSRGLPQHPVRVFLRTRVSAEMSFCPRFLKGRLRWDRASRDEVTAKQRRKPIHVYESTWMPAFAA